MSGFWSMKIGGGKKDKNKSPKRERKATSVARDSSAQGSSSVIVRSLMERALADAEQLVESIKVKAQKEAGEEIARIIEQESQTGTEITSPVGITEESQAQVDAEPIAIEEFQEKVEIEAVPAVTEELEEHAEVKAEPAITENLEEQAEIKTEPAIMEQNIEESPVPKEEITITKPVESPVDEYPEVPSAEEKAEDTESFPAAIELDRKAMYSEEIELAISVPVDPVAVSRLYNSLQMTPEIKILYTRGSWDRGTVITVTLEKPLPLMDIITGMPGIEVTPIETPGKDTIKGTSSALLGGDKKEIKRIDLKMKAK